MRQGFTLIELLVVIAIIAVLMALVSAAVIPLILKGPETVCRNDLGQLGVAVAAMQKDFGLRSPPPSLLFLSNKRDDYFDTTLPYPNLRKESFAYLSKMFPRNNWSGSNVTDWGLPTSDPAVTKGVILEGDQCLVFFLGGPDGVNGFSTNPANPTDATTTERKGPYYSFPPGRLKAFPTSAAGTPCRSSTALSFVDGYNSSSIPKPYAYFSSGSRTNGYGTHAAEYGSSCKEAGIFGNSSGSPLSPFLQSTSPKRYFNASTVQIVCAGYDGVFGKGDLWDPTNPTPIKEGRDDMTNFHGYRMDVAD